MDSGRGRADQIPTLLAADVVVPNQNPETTRDRWRPTTILGDIGVLVALVGAAALSVVLTLGISQLTLGHADMDQPSRGPGPSPPAISTAYDSHDGTPTTPVGQQVRDAQHLPALSTLNGAPKPASG